MVSTTWDRLKAVHILKADQLYILNYRVDLLKRGQARAQQAIKVRPPPVPYSSHCNLLHSNRQFIDGHIFRIEASKHNPSGRHTRNRARDLRQIDSPGSRLLSSLYCNALYKIDSVTEAMSRGS